MTLSVGVDPQPEALRALLRGAAGAGSSSPRASEPHLLGATLAEWRARTRGELGLPSDRPVVASGHQAAFWHPGIVAKSMLAHGLAEAVGGAAAHVVVEQDTEPVATLAVPVRAADGALRRTTVELMHAPEGVVAGRLPPFDPAVGPQRAALPAVEAGLVAIESALRARRGEANAALQVTRAAFDLLRPLLPAPHLLRPAELLRTTLGAALCAQIANDPLSAAQAYNRAVAGTHDAPTLTVGDDRVEIPLWRLDEDGRRLRAWDDDLPRFAEGAVELLPRALLMTGILRLAVCDLFVHGTGGVVYDRSMERWFSRWLGVPVAPAALATATLLLPFPESALPRADLAAAQRRSRERWFDPERLAPAGGELKRGAGAIASVSDQGACAGPGPGPAKRAMLAAIEAHPRGTLERRAAWRAMHRGLESLRESQASALAALRTAVDDARRQAAQSRILDDRSWPFPFHSLVALAALRDALR